LPYGYHNPPGKDVNEEDTALGKKEVRIVKSQS